MARDFARQALHDWGWLPASSADRRAAAEDVLLVVSELVTNACLHAEGPEELRIGRTPKALRVEVVDRAASPPPARRTAPAAPAGTACSSCSASAWTGACSVRRRRRARPSGRSSPHPHNRFPPHIEERADPARLLSSLHQAPGVPLVPNLMCRQ
ncbi:non-specific serine/threonine protein kinase OS=Streptomyces microflavus OX=1919 GN=Smic_29830 PE=3 SV=1 [Streptomyces microflavus]